MNSRVAVASLALLAACASIPRGGPIYAFPEEFAASQVVTIHGEDASRTLIASLWRNDSSIEVTFLDPTLLVPVVSARLSAGEFTEERFVAFSMSPSEVEALLRDVAALYGSRAIREDGAASAARVGPWDVSLSSPTGGGDCAFPERITLRVRGRAFPWIDVKTLGVRCGSR